MKYCALVLEYHYFKTPFILDRIIQYMLKMVLPDLIPHLLCEMKVHMKAHHSDLVFVK